MTHEFLGQLSSQKKTFQQNTISAAQLGELIDMVQSGAITGTFPLIPRLLPVQNKISNHIVLFSGTTGKHLIRHMLTNPTTASPFQLASSLDLLALSSPPSSSTPSTPTNTNAGSSQTMEDPLLAICEKAIVAHPSVAEAAKKGNRNVLNKIVGVVMKESRGRADARRVREVVERLVYGDGES
jgi:aspartyl-tRNA(Asn)/glutamyl-tRNA(Gln) amidotransferase subunit B